MSETEYEYFAPEMDDAETNNNGGGEFHYDGTPTTSIFEAPDYANLVKTTRSASAKEYENKVKSMVKAGTLASLRLGNEPDAAALLHYGSPFAAAIGDLTDVSDTVRKGIDILTAPDSPWFVAAAITAPMIFQLFRNHESEIKEINKTRKQIRLEKKLAKERGEFVEKPKRHIEIKLPFGRKISLNVRFRIPVISQAALIFRAQTRPPEELANMVFADPALRRALKKMGFEVKSGS